MKEVFEMISRIKVLTVLTVILLIVISFWCLLVNKFIKEVKVLESEVEIIKINQEGYNGN